MFRISYAAGKTTVDLHIMNTMVHLLSHAKEEFIREQLAHIETINHFLFSVASSPAPTASLAKALLSELEEVPKQNNSIRHC